MQELYHRLQKLADEYSSLKFQCEAGVTIWKWATFCRYDPRPFYYERQRWRPGRLLKTAPSNLDGKYEYGYDASGRILVERQYVGAMGKSQFQYAETFYTYKENSVESAHFSYHDSKEPINCERSTYFDGRIVLCESYAQRGSSRERYHWEDSKITLIEIECSEFENLSEFFDLKSHQRIEPKYNRTGLLEELISYQNLSSDKQPKSYTLYSRLDSKITFKMLLTLAQEKLIENIIQKVSILNIEESVYCLAISWEPGQFSSLPPYIGLGLNQERERWLKEQGDEAKWYLWNPEEFSIYSNLEDNELVRICELLNQECGRRERWNNATKLLNEVAKHLAAIDWSDRLQTTSDFVVYATDSEQSDFRKNFKFSVPSNLLAKFKKAGWLP